MYRIISAPYMLVVDLAQGRELRHNDVSWPQAASGRARGPIRASTFTELMTTLSVDSQRVVSGASPFGCVRRDLCTPTAHRCYSWQFRGPSGTDHIMPLAAHLEPAISRHVPATTSVCSWPRRPL
jgi:hypothetical protein